jgi:peptidylprolyl isomerase
MARRHVWEVACAAWTASAVAAVPAWQPVPVRNAGDPAAAIAEAEAADWREIAPENLLLFELKDGRRVAIELAPAFAPVHAANIRALSRHGWWRGSAIYRVQDNYVVQWGRNEDQKPDPLGVVALPPAEYEREFAGLAIRPLGYPDSYAPLVGHVDGWPVGYDEARGRAWLAHCYAMVGVARDLAPDTGRGGELYAIIGHAPRHLDRNIALVGRVIEGMEVLSSRPRGTEALGVYRNRSEDAPIVDARLAADMPEAERPSYEVLRTESAAFSTYVAGRANRSGAFFAEPAGGVDLCNAPVPVRRKK